MDYISAYKKGIEQLEGVGITEAKLDARLLLEHVCGTAQNDIYAHPDRVLTESEEKLFCELIDRRAGREPVAYILGYWEFMGLKFTVSGDVLIPEQDSEFLVEEALRYCQDGFTILDLCTGSGCIALGILGYTNDTRAVCTDISENALKIARKNAEDLGLSDRTEFIETDLFPEKGSVKADILISNPPYIKRSVIDTLEPEVRDFEPRLALDGDEDGLVFYRRIIRNAGDFLYSSGLILLEIGYDQAAEVKKLLEDEGHFHDIEVIRDFSGNDRVVKAFFY